MASPAFRRAGFTLIELMVTIAIIGILAGIALPSYQEHVRRSGLQQAFADLADMRVKLEQYYQNNRNYGVVGQGCGHDGIAQRVSLAGGEGFAYQCALSIGGGSATNQAYTITATGNASRTTGHVYTLDSNNTRRTTQFKSQAQNKNCWLSKGSEC